MHTPKPAQSDPGSIQKVTFETDGASWAELTQHQFASIQKLKAENQALRKLIVDWTKDGFLSNSWQPQVAAFTLQGVTHRIFVYQDDEGVIHMIEA